MQSRAAIQGAATAAFIAGVLVGAAAWPAQAHHSFAMFDRTKQVTLKGAVRQFQWTNPHIFVEMVVQGPTGPENWSVEGASPNMLYRQGWGADSFKPGDQVTVVINPLKNGERGGTFLFATLPNGKTLGSLNTRAPG